MKLLLVDDHSLFLEGLTNLLLARGLEVVATAAGGLEALDKAERFRPDVVLMDIMMKPLSGLATTRLLKAKFPAMNIIMLTASEAEADLFEAIKSGASGYFLKSLDAQELSDWLLAYETGELPVSSTLAARLQQEFISAGAAAGLPENERPNPLSEQQERVLLLVAQGLKYRHIAVVLDISERTVKYHMEAILHKLHLENRSQAVKYAFQEGMVK